MFLYIRISDVSLLSCGKGGVKLVLENGDALVEFEVFLLEIPHKPHKIEGLVEPDQIIRFCKNLWSLLPIQ